MNSWKTRICVASAMVLVSIAGYSFKEVKKYADWRSQNGGFYCARQNGLVDKLSVELNALSSYKHRNDFKQKNQDNQMQNAEQEQQRKLNGNVYWI